MSSKKYAGRDPIPFSSQAEMTLWLNDKRYRGNLNEQDPEYQDHCKERLLITPDEILGAGTDLRALMNEPGGKDFQDPNNDLGKLTDVYHDMSEARVEQSSQLYKTSPFERARVAEKISRSVPDEAVMPENRGVFRVEVGSGGGGEDAGG